MIPDIIIAAITSFYLISFWIINLFNILLNRRTKTESRAYAEIESPKGVAANLAVIGTLLFFIEMVGFPIAVFFGVGRILYRFPLQLWVLFSWVVQIVGIIILGCGWFLFLWSVLVRGRYSVSWTMTKDHKLVTSGPFRYIRHPSYMGYFMMFIGFFLMWMNLVALLPLLAIPGYVGVVEHEEQLLIQRFGEEYKQYQQRTGRFLPKFRKSNHIR